MNEDIESWDYYLSHIKRAEIDEIEKQELYQKWGYLMSSTGFMAGSVQA